MPPSGKKRADYSRASARVGALLRVGVDAGGTFTDLYAQFEDGRTVVLKVPSTPDAPARAVREGLRRLGARGAELVHGTTLVTNALLTRTGARTALVTTAGVEGLLAVARQDRPRLHALRVERPPPLVPPERTFGVAERTDDAGRSVRPPRTAELAALCRRLRASRAEAVAVALLNAHASSAHERRVARSLAPLGVPVTCSGIVAPEHREYERAQTAAADAYVRPLAARALVELGRAAGRRLRVMLSSGGTAKAARAAAEPVRLVLSGPAGGAVAALWLARAHGAARAISVDIGGTSTDVARLESEVPFSPAVTVAGLPLRVPAIDVHTVGAGGGSLARIDAAGALAVGPDSAGADPGPMCYGRGGRIPTVTDAHLVLGRLPARGLLGGAMPLDSRRAEAGIARLARRLGVSTAAVAQAVVEGATASTARAVRAVTLGRGRDPREFCLVAFGGAGGLHACELARAIGARTVLVPSDAGAFAARGMLVADAVRDETASVLHAIAPRGAVPADAAAAVRAGFARVTARARAALAREGARHIAVQTYADARYAGQSFELSVPVDRPIAEAVRDAFIAAHRRTYGTVHARDVEIVAIRARASAPPLAPAAVRVPRGRGARPYAHQAAVIHGRVWRVGVFERATLGAGDRLRGPAIVAEYSGTVFLPPGAVARVMSDGTLRVDVG